MRLTLIFAIGLSLANAHINTSADIPAMRQEHSSKRTGASASSVRKMDTRSNTHGNHNIFSFSLNPTVFLHPAHDHDRASASASAPKLNASGDSDKDLELDRHLYSTPRSRNSQVGSVYVGLDYLSVHEHEHGQRDGHLKDGTSIDVDLEHRRQLIDDHNEMVRTFQEQRKYSRFEHARKMKQNPKGLNFRSLSLYNNDNEGTAPKNSNESDSESLVGGSFDAYQTAPLSQGIGTHYATVYIGSPMPQPQTLIVDTGSHHTAFPCKPCKNCGETYHADAYFDPNQSDTFRKLMCGQCTADVNKSCSGNGECSLSQSYAEGSSWRAYQARDVFFCGYNHPKQIEVAHSAEHEHEHEYDISKLDDKYAMPFTFGCQNHLTGLFIEQLADGIMGMSATETTLPKQLYDAKIIEHNMFSMCFSRNVKHEKDGITAGVLTLGGVDERLQRSPMVYAHAQIDAYHGWYAVHVKRFWLRKNGGLSAKAGIQIDKGGHPGKLQKPQFTLVSKDEKMMNTGSGIIVDSGTTDSYFSRSLKKPFENAFKAMTGMSYSNRRMTLTKEQVLELPTILIQMTPHDLQAYDTSMDANSVVGLAGKGLSPEYPQDIIIAIPPTHYMEYTDGKSYTPRVYFSESSGGVLGANAMMNHDVSFDWENRRVGFSESTCDYDLLMEGSEIAEDTGAMGDGASKDCILGEPNVEQNCHVDTITCTEDDGDKRLDGTMMWEMLVEQENFDDGRDCVSVAKSRFKDENTYPNPVRAGCNGAGVCTALVPCSITCADAVSKQNSTNASDDDDDTANEPDANDANSGQQEGDKGTLIRAPCPNEGWGSCQASCQQSKVFSKLRHDGDCHVHHVEQRSCHIDSCGRHDPCIVPFKVHSIIMFAGANSSLWDKNDEEIFIDSFVNVVNMEREPGDELFGSGDVKVFSVGPWKVNDEEFYEAEDEHDDNINAKMGMQIVLEVSIYNDDVVFPSDEDTSNNDTNVVALKGKQVMHLITGPDHATCRESDIYHLSQTALDVHLELGKNDFMENIIMDIRRNIGHDAVILHNSVFAPIGDEGKSTDNSAVLTSWTVKTETGIFNGSFDVLDRDDLSANTLLVIALSLFLFAVCYFGVCCGTFCTRRRYRLMEAKNTLMKSAKERRAEKERGQYATIDGGVQMDGDDLGEIELGSGIDSFQDHPIDTVDGNEKEDLNFEDDVDSKMSRLK